MGSMCFKCVGSQMYCSKCDTRLIKYGFTQSNNQRYRCKECKTTAVSTYKYNSYNQHINERTVAFTREGVGIRSTARLLKIAINTVLARIKKIAKNVALPPISLNQTYEVDELCTFVKN